MSYQITETHPNGVVNARIELTFTAGGQGAAKFIASAVEAELVRLAGTLHVPAVPVRDDES